MDYTEIESAIAQMDSAIAAIQQPRSDYALARFVVGEKDTEPMAYAQCVLELQIKRNAIRRGLLTRQKLTIEASQLRRRGDAVSAIEAEMKDLDVEETDLALLGARREFEALYRIFQAFPKHYTYEELQGAQAEYYHKRLVRQSLQDINANGQIGVANLDALRQAGIEPHRLPDGRFALPIWQDAPAPQLAGPDASATP